MIMINISDLKVGDVFYYQAPLFFANNEIYCYIRKSKLRGMDDSGHTCFKFGLNGYVHFDINFEKEEFNFYKLN